VGKVLIGGGPKLGPAQLQAEADFRAALARGDEVFTERRGVFFRVQLGEGDAISYEAMASRPEGV
jgi:hypothetical protein